MTNKDDKWIEIFFENFFDESATDERLIKCLNFKNEKMPNQLYQYTKTKYAKDLLCNKLMYLRNIKDLNDPFEGDLLADLEKLNLEGWDEYKRTFKIACFSERNDINPMWAHYGDNHKGICIEYNFNDNENFKDQCMPINYVKNTNNNTVIEKFQNGSFVKNRLIWEVFSKKSEDWRYEKEWRLIYDNQVTEEIGTIFSDNINKKYLLFLKPTAVYLGLKIDGKDKKSIIDMCNFNNIKIYQMKKNNSNYNLISCEI